MDMIDITGSTEDVLFELYAMQDFYLRFYDIQDEETKKEFDITLKTIDEKIKELEE